MDEANISVLIPSLNRGEHLIKQLKFYNSLKSKINILICDSTPIPSKELLNLIDYYSKNLTVKYFNEPALNDRQAIFHLIKKCETKYSAFIGDDDLLIPEGMLKAADFLENNQNFRVACGQSIIADESFLNKNYKRKVFGPYWGSPLFKQENALDRLSSLSKNYFVSMFALHRTNEFLEDYKPCEDIPSKEMGEFLINYITIARGKAMFLDTPYLIRKDHSNRYLVGPNILDSLVDENFAESIPIFIENIKLTLEKSNLSKDIALSESKKLIKKIIFKKLIRHSTNKKRELSIINSMNNLFKRIYYGMKNLRFRRSPYSKNFYKYFDLIDSIS